METNMMLWIFMMGTCFWWTCTSSFLRSVALEATEPTRISGVDGYCVEVNASKYNDRNPITIEPCKSDSDVSQLWTFESDGTIRSNGKCLSSYGYAQGDYIMIYTCGILGDNKIWEVRDPGLIVNPRSGLVLTAITPTVGTVLTLQSNISSSFQTWRVDNNTEPTIVIIGVGNLCMQATPNLDTEDANSVSAEPCDQSKEEQRWYTYPDGTIRPSVRPDGCLNYDNLIDGKVVILSCGLGPSSQRWLSTTNIMNPRTGVVLYFVGSNVMVRPPTSRSPGLIPTILPYTNKSSA